MRLLPPSPPAPILGIYLPGGHEAASYYRVQVPMRAISPDGAWLALGEGTAAHRDAARVVVVSRFSGDAAYNLAAIRAYQADGVRVLLDYDDDPDALPAASLTPQKRALLETLRILMRAVDAVVTTNRTLAGRLRRYNPDARVLPNYVCPDDWPAPQLDVGGPTVITLTGSVSHEEDWKIVAAPLARIKADYGDRVRLRVAGHLPRYLAGLCDEHRPWANDLSGYPAMLAGTHIGLCPLPESGFNRCKSPIKAYEFALSGAAVIGSPCQYGPILDAAGCADGIARTRDDWERQIRRYVDDPDARRHARAALRGWVMEHCDAQRRVATIRAAYAA